MRVEIAVTGLGLVTPAGHTVEANWAALCRGRSLAATDPGLAGLPVDFSCQVTDFEAETELGRASAWSADRFIQFALARRAVADAGLDRHTWEAGRVGVVLGVGSNSLSTYVTEFGHLGAGRPERVSPLALPRSVPSMAAGEVAIDLGARGLNFTTASACASGATAIGVARDLLRSGTCDIVLAAGSESVRSRMTATCFARMRALSRRTAEPTLAGRPFDAQRDGFVLGEGAGILVLERACAARARRAPALADLLLAVSPHTRGAREARVQDGTTAVTKKLAGQRDVKTVWSARTTGDTWLRSKDGRTLLVAVGLKGMDKERKQAAPGVVAATRSAAPEL
ncbi:beta-ketoacyl-[acyl-carrier-protein] synthase family protein [Streptomyces huasconensis]|uniref:beta-ketoacyl-[acyl-carrier-protein] synthase family protein n=1 Tax=Streptomyces huasconensis TaxID=1854574 RepID=UPI0036FAE8B0